MEKQKDIMANKLVVAPAPHVQTSQSTARIMRDVVIALMPALVVSMVVFGVDVLRVTALSVACCVFRYDGGYYPRGCEKWRSCPA